MADRRPRNDFPSPPPAHGLQTLPGMGPGTVASIATAMGGTTTALVPVTPAPRTEAELRRLGYAELGVTGLRQWAGRVYEEWLLPELDPYKAPFVYRQMADTEPFIGASLLLITMMLSRVAWTIQPAAQTPEAELEAEWLRGALFQDMLHPWSETLQEILTMLKYGWSTLEINFKRRQGPQDDPMQASQFDDGLVGWASWEPRAQETRWQWRFDPHGRVTGLVQRDPITGVLRPDIPLRWKLLLFRTVTEKGSPEGKSMLRTAYELWRLKRSLRISLGLGLKRDLEGVPIMWQPAEVLYADPAVDPVSYQIAQGCARVLEDFVRDRVQAIHMPSDTWEGSTQRRFDITLLNANGVNNGRLTGINSIIDGLNLEMTIAFFTDLFLMGHMARGTQSLGTVKQEVFTEALTMINNSIAEIINRDAVPVLWRFNDKDPALMPTLQAGRVTRLDLNEWGSFLLRLSQAGVSVSGPAKQVLDWVGLGAGDLPDEDLEDMPETALSEGTTSEIDMDVEAGTGAVTTA